MRPVRLGVICDYPEEGWPSMDLFGEMVLSHLGRDHADRVAATRVCPPFRSRMTRWSIARRMAPARNADRLLNRVWDYPRALGRLVRRGEFDLYHLVDHSYAQLVHVLPPGRTVVTCHDLDTFRCLLDPAREPRPRWFRAIVRRTLEGLQKASAVVCDSEATRAALQAHDLIESSRLHVIYPGIPPEFSSEADPAADAEADRLLGPSDRAAPPELLHVGSNIARKRIDVLLSTFAAVLRAHPGARLIKIGGPLTPTQSQMADDLGVSGSIVAPPLCPRATLAAIYRRASLVLQPSEAEGFGLPVAEALACGAPVLASDLDVLREVGGDSATYRPVGDLPAWSDAALALLDHHHVRSAAWHARRASGIERARRFQWSTHVERLLDIYEAIGCS